MPFFKEEKLVNVLNWIPNIKRIKPIEITKYTIEGKNIHFMDNSWTIMGLLIISRLRINF